MSAPTFIYPPPTTGGTPVGGSGTPGTIPVWSTGTTLGDSQLVQSATGIYTTTRNIGIGVDPGAVKFRIIGGAANDWVIRANASGTIGQSYGILLDAGTNASDTAFQLRSASGASTHLFVRGDGNVGIGTASPNFRLTVQGAAGSIAQFSNGANADLLINLTAGVSLITPATGTLALGTSSVERARIDSSGNVGIGTASPNQRIHAHSSAFSACALQITNSTSGSAATDGVLLQSNATDAYLWNYESGFFAFGTNNAERMRITSAGNVHAASGTTTMTDGFFYIPAAAGAPTGVPTAIAGRVPMYYDTTNDQFYIRNGANWRKVTLT